MAGVRPGGPRTLDALCVGLALSQRVAHHTQSERPTGPPAQNGGPRHRAGGAVAPAHFATPWRDSSGRGWGLCRGTALGLQCQRQQVTLLAPLRLDARLFEPPMRLVGKLRGRPQVVGARLPTLAQIALAPTTRWHRSLVPWYGGTHTVVDWTTGTALWYTTGTRRWPSAGSWFAILRANDRSGPSSHLIGPRRPQHHHRLRQPLAAGSDL